MGLDKYAQRLHAALVIPAASPDHRFQRNDTPKGGSFERSRQTGISGHDKPEWVVTIGQNDRSR
jgi:hypothetical protein